MALMISGNDTVNELMGSIVEAVTKIMNLNPDPENLGYLLDILRGADSSLWSFVDDLREPVK